MKVKLVALATFSILFSQIVNGQKGHSIKSASACQYNSIETSKNIYDSLMKILYDSSLINYDTTVVFSENFNQTIFNLKGELFEGYSMNTLKEENERLFPFAIRYYFKDSKAYSANKNLGYELRLNLKTSDERGNTFLSIYGRIIKSIRMTKGKAVESLNRPYYIGNINDKYTSEYIDFCLKDRDTIVNQKKYKSYQFFYKIKYSSSNSPSVLKTVLLKILWDSARQALIYKESFKKETDLNNKAYLEYSKEVFENIGEKIVLKEFDYLSPRSTSLDPIYSFNDSLYTHIKFSRNFLNTEDFNNEIKAQPSTPLLTNWEELWSMATLLDKPTIVMEKNVIKIPLDFGY